MAEIHDFAVPEILVERQIEKRLDAVRRQIEASGMSPQSLQIDWNRMRASQRDGAVVDVKSTFILEKIADQNSLQPDDADLEGEIQRIAAETRQPYDVIYAHLTKDGGLDRIKSRLRIEKALEFALQNVSKMLPRGSVE